MTLLLKGGVGVEPAFVLGEDDETTTMGFCLVRQKDSWNCILYILIEL